MFLEFFSFRGYIYPFSIKYFLKIYDYGSNIKTSLSKVFHLTIKKSFENVIFQNNSFSMSYVSPTAKYQYILWEFWNMFITQGWIITVNKFKVKNALW